MHEFSTPAARQMHARSWKTFHLDSHTLPYATIPYHTIPYSTIPGVYFCWCIVLSLYTIAFEHQNFIACVFFTATANCCCYVCVFWSTAFSPWQVGVGGSYRDVAQANGRGSSHEEGARRRHHHRSRPHQVRASMPLDAPNCRPVNSTTSE